MEMQIVECPKCAAKNRINAHPDKLKPICGRCGSTLFNDDHEKTNISLQRKFTLNSFLSLFLIVLSVAVIFGIVATPTLMHKDFSLLIAAEAHKTELLKKQLEDELALRKAFLKIELAAIDAKELQLKATQNYREIFKARKSFDKRFALSSREKAQLQMRNLANDSTKSFHDAIRSVAQEASPEGADVRVHESSRGITLHIDFDMSSVTSGEHGTRTKHHTKSSLRKEVISLISRVTNDIFQFCRDLDFSSIHVGCRHYVNTTYPDKTTRDENKVLYKIRIRKNRLPHLQSNPYLDIYSTTKYFEVDEDNFDEIKIITSRS